jgi:linoleoyl-CoA desaturase
MSQTLSPVKFSNQSKSQIEFFKTLNKRVSNYFTENNIEKTGNTTMYVKTVFMFALYFVPYTIILLYGDFSWVLAVFLCVLMGFGLAGIGLSVMHDANHGAYSKSKKINDLIGYSLNLVGGASFNWKLQHNVLHHSYTNIEGYDEDIDTPIFLRFSPHAKLSKFHRFQHLYAWFFYGLMSFFWIIAKDFPQVFRYQKMGLLQRYSTLAKELTIIIVTKILYYAYIIVLPYYLLDYSIWTIFLGFFIMHFVAGLVLALIFQPAHVMEHLDFPVPNNEGSLENNWAIHQLNTTTNFAPNNKLLSWYVGGLNYQVEHHLFPNICHVHYNKIAPIVKQTAQEFGIPYYSIGTFRKAVSSHWTMLRKLGRGEYVRKEDFVQA